jgi:uncharacterized protein
MTRVAIFEDNPEEQAGWVRRQYANDHFDYLKKHAQTITLAGGLRPSPDDWWSGGLWVATREQAVALCENDPYFKLGLRRSYRLYVWGKAPSYGSVAL